MLSETKKRLLGFIDDLKCARLGLRISTKISLIYAVILMAVFGIANVLTGLGVYFSFYHQAEIEIEMSLKHLEEEIGEHGGLFFLDEKENPVLPGVVLRITDGDGRLIFESSERYPRIEDVEKNEIANPPFWASPRMEVSEFDNFVIYHAKTKMEYNGRPYTFHLFRTITADREFLSGLQYFLFVSILIGCLLALAAGYFVSKKALSPIMDITRMAKEIEVEHLGRRLEMPKTKDELYTLSETFNHMLDRLERGFMQQQRFVSDASHELRTPVTVILGYSDLLSRWGREDEKVLDEGITSIRSEAENMQALIEKLLFLARADQKRQVLHMETLDIGEILEDVMEKMELIEKKHSVALLKCEHGLVRGDGVTMRQLLRIFLENSSKYTPEGGHITASCEKKGKAMEVVLADDGIGIAPEDQAKVFERFYRVDSSRTKSEAGGTGLGLSIARWIADQHAIEIKLISALGEGTSIHLLIPLLEAGEESKTIT